MDSSDNVIRFWLPGSGIMQNTPWLLNSHMAHAWCLKFIKVRRWGIQLVEHSITQVISMCTQSFWTRLLSMLCTLFVCIQSATSSGNPHSAIFISYGSLMSCIICSWVWLKTYCTGYSNTWKLEQSRINLTINSNQYPEIQASSASHTIRFDDKQLLAGQRDPGHEQNTGSELRSNSGLLQGWQENSGRNRLCWDGDGSSAGIIWILSTC